MHWVLFYVFYMAYLTQSLQLYVLNTFYFYFFDKEIGINSWLNTVPPGPADNKWQRVDCNPNCPTVEPQPQPRDLIELPGVSLAVCKLQLIK